MRPFFVFALTCALLTAAFAQNDSAADPWQNLSRKGEPVTSVDISTTTGRAQAIATYVADADALEAFSTANSNSSHVKEAQRREAMALLYARSLGDTTQAIRCKQLVARLRKDSGIDPEEREHLAAFSDNLDVASKPFPSFAQRIGEYELTARALQAEFPGSALIYESLNGIAEASPDDRAVALARDLLKMPAPDREKTRAETLIDRLALKGSSLSDLAATALGANNPITAAVGHPVVIYSWATSASPLIDFLNRASASLPADTVWVGVCLDAGDLTAARAFALSAHAPGAQIFDELGGGGKFAGAAKLTSIGVIYLVDRKGNAASVSAQNDIPALNAIVSNL